MEIIDFSLLDFNKNDYLLIHNRVLVNLKHSPYLSKKNDLCSYHKAKPVIPSYIKNYDGYIYIYKLCKKNKFRSVCP